MVKPRIKVVIADDEAHVRDFLASIMECLNFEIVGKATNGIEAEAIYREKRPDLMLLDINMPIKTGVQALEELLDEFPDAFIIMLTAVSDVESIKKCLSLGAAYFILKDTPMPKMINLIQETIENFEEKKRQNARKPNLANLLSEIEEDEQLCPSVINNSR